MAGYLRACRGCSQLAVDPLDPPRYDVLNAAADPELPALAGPYCASCWPITVSAEIERGRAGAPTPDPQKRER